MCIRCSSGYLEVTQELLIAKIEEFKKWVARYLINSYEWI